MNRTEVVSLISELVKEYRFRRHDDLTDDLARIVGDANASGRLRSGFLVADVERRCAQELIQRCDRWLSVMTDVLDAADLRIEEETSEVLTSLLLRELTTDSDQIYEIYRQQVRVAAENPPSAGIEGAKTRSRDFARQRVRLMALRHRARQPPLEELLRAPRYEAVRVAWATAVQDQRAGRVTSAARNAVGSVEQLARIATGDEKVTLGKALGEVRRSERMAPHLVAAVEKLWAFRSDTPGLGHGAGDEPGLSADDLAVAMVLSEAGLMLFLFFDRAA
jgi:hypothetical protein